jgi:SAM-dependent methyltransferase
VSTEAVPRQLEEREAWLECLINHVRPGRIVEFGCGSGFVLEFLSERFSGSEIVGVDRDMGRLRNVVEKRLDNVLLVKADILLDAFRQRVFDTALFVGSLHEVFSYSGGKMVERAFQIAHAVLKQDGVLLIQDFLKPSPTLVKLGLRNDKTSKRFFRFAREFRPRSVSFDRTEEGVRLDIADAVEFISKYRSPTEEDWEEEMGEAHFAFAEGDYRGLAQRAGFHVHELTVLPKQASWWAPVREDIDFRFEPQYGWVQVVQTKRAG